MSSSTDKITGKSKQTVGKVTGNKKLQAEGKMQEMKGKAEKGMNDLHKNM